MNHHHVPQVIKQRDDGTNGRQYRAQADWSAARYFPEPFTFKTPYREINARDYMYVPLTGHYDEGWFDQADQVLECRQAVRSTLDPCQVALARGEGQGAVLLYEVAADAKPERVRERVDRLLAEANGLFNDGGGSMDIAAAREEGFVRLEELADALRSTSATVERPEPAGSRSR